ncbi:unnamed protein product [Aspergillus oryzae]|uniref:Unnamed protein product n=2 Tax=Aspergillus oryzae TaxID=5062 RepID=A0AAN4YXM6_ASPOZ|nr:unnamed protein product [Aspergillus oryzae]GMF94383.1 unnamed protein product [Aspergillus oryzae]GMG15963.1 unnamed protein product [Aspergillus oryzae]GMG39000.1 unnamed protein product [Aspergillus oryzae]GMG54162.1 unnamed protein product [Aspergillus oryzae var. brunneus]
MKEVRIFRQEKKRRKFNVEYVDLELVLWSLASKDTTLPSIPRRQIVVQPTQLARTPLSTHLARTPSTVVDMARMPGLARSPNFPGKDGGGDGGSLRRGGRSSDD